MSLVGGKADVPVAWLELLLLANFGHSSAFSSAWIFLIVVVSLLAEGERA
jgi:hypothetical protein